MLDLGAKNRYVYDEADKKNRAFAFTLFSSIDLVSLSSLIMNQYLSSIR